MTAGGAWGGQGGFSVVELLAGIALIASLVAFASSLAGTMVKRGRMLGTAREIRSVLWEARISAIRSGRPVVAQFYASTGEVIIFRDYSNNPALPHTGVLAVNDGNGVQNLYADAADNEPTLRSFRLREGLIFRRPGGAPADVNSVAFDGTVPEPLVPPVDDRIIFLPTGRTMLPSSLNSRRPTPLSGGVFDCANARGVYLSDQTGLDFFRVSVDDLGIGGKVSLLKYLEPQTGVPGERYGPEPWTWKK